MTFSDAKQRFSNRVADYVRYRPGYPAEVLILLRSDCGLRSGHVVADIGSGTGFLSELFLKNGNRVYGIEPNEGMRAAGEEYLAGCDVFFSIALRPKPRHWKMAPSISLRRARRFTGSILRRRAANFSGL